VSLINSLMKNYQQCGGATMSLAFDHDLDFLKVVHTMPHTVPRILPIVAFFRASETRVFIAFFADARLRPERSPTHRCDLTLLNAITCNMGPPV